jgi:hypothetical protein
MPSRNAQKGDAASSTVSPVEDSFLKNERRCNRWPFNRDCTPYPEPSEFDIAAQFENTRIVTW